MVSSPRIKERVERIAEEGRMRTMMIRENLFSGKMGKVSV
jgi:hypothetical protein